MINSRQLIFKLISIFIFIFFLIFANNHQAAEILLYGDKIDYDEEENIIARGNGKIIYDNKLLTSELIIYKKKSGKVFLPTNFKLKDEEGNFYFGSKGTFDKNLNNGDIENVKILLNDGSRIVGVNGKRRGNIDIISKGVFSPCKSRIKIGNFICPTWQLEGEKIIHDNEKLFLYNKHSKMRIVNTPVYYLPYLVTPSPLRKKRKSGFLSPSISFYFIDVKTEQNVSFPYYFNLAEDKELTLNPIFRYGGGADSSQTFMFDYNQLISGGNLNVDLNVDSNFDNQNSDKWLENGSLITSYNQNLNANYKLSFESALQTSKNYIQNTTPNNYLSYKNSLSTRINLQGFDLKKYDDELNINATTYTVNQNNEDNKTTPTVLPHIDYYSGIFPYKNYEISHLFQTYNIFRDKHTNVHAQNQQKLSHSLYTDREYIKFGTKFRFATETHNQVFHTENKLIESDFHKGSYYRIFPILGLSMRTPFKFKNSKNDFVYSPNAMIVLAPGMSNTNKLSNEDSAINTYSIANNIRLNRFSGTDKMDNSKRLNYGFNINNELWDFAISQQYEFTNNSNYHYGQGNEEKLSDILGNAAFNKAKLKAYYDFRYDYNESFLKQHSIGIENDLPLATIELKYLGQRSKTDEVITDDLETLNYSLVSKKLFKYNEFTFSGLYDFNEAFQKEYKIGYTYFDDCFGISLNFGSSRYADDNLKPKHSLTVMFSFKHIGSYRSTNLAVSETDKQDIRWFDSEVSDEMFN
ncbi:MAG: hypothetical protein CMI96_01400 [Pelagibacteraceae bacterium]|nr:hypothetical protein [Pelagibacteraceae bacterium]|tara:strand:+ start:8480 stop:10726 length:2247 start_codon:yes stop_codon:yes gene_type:complete